jgi:uncharacterized protein
MKLRSLVLSGLTVILLSGCAATATTAPSPAASAPNIAPIGSTSGTANTLDAQTGRVVQAAQPAQVPAGTRYISVVGRGEAQGRPDTATVQIGVETEAASAQAALSQNSTQASAVQAKLKELGVADADIQTSNFNIGSIYGADGRQVTGYRVSNMVTVTVRGLDQTGALLDQVVQAGANQIYGISFSVSDPAAQLAQARQQAMADAKARADTLAQAAGASVGEVLVISENLGGGMPIPMMMAAGAREADMAAPVQPGEQRFSIDVQVTYALR